MISRITNLKGNKLYLLERVVGSTKCGNCLIYPLSCKCCDKQYVGELIDSFRYGWNNYKDTDRKHSHKDSCMQEHLFKHFNSMRHNGFCNNVLGTLIDKTDGKNSKMRED